MKNYNERKILSIVSLVFGILLLGIKFYAYHVTGSQSIFSDALESIVNVVAGTITIAVMVIALKPADEDHPYGHGKVENMAATFEGGAITLAGILIIIQAVQVFFHGAKIEDVGQGLLLTIFAGLVNGCLGLILLYRGKKLHSDALKSSGTHLLSDAYTSIGVILSLVIVKYTGAVWVDPLIAAFFGMLLCYFGGKILIRSGSVLLDAQDIETLKLVADIFEKNYTPGIIDIHYTRIIRSGSFHHVDCHIVIPEFWSVSEAHLFSEDFETTFNKYYPTSSALRIHLDPCRRVYCENCELKDCPIREKKFVKRTPLNNLKDLISPIENR